MKADVCNMLEYLQGSVQFRIPRWQRRFSWGRPELERLVADIVTVADAGPDAGHLLGTIITIPDLQPTQDDVQVFRVVDGQQRLTAVSILLVCIAEALGQETHASWTESQIHTDLLWNSDAPPSTTCKLRLQDRDNSAYQRCLQGADPEPGTGSVPNFWSMSRKYVDMHTPRKLLDGLVHLKIVRAVLDVHDNAQQIFESLNTTGKPLSESEKIKNWMLMRLSDDDQAAVYDRHWLPMEASIGAHEAPGNADDFFYSILCLETGEATAKKNIYREFSGQDTKRSPNELQKMFCQLQQMACLYGMVTGTGTEHPDDDVARELRFLRSLTSNTYRPLALRLLRDSQKPNAPDLGEFVCVLKAVSTWFARLWCADGYTPGLNKVCAHLSGLAGPNSVGPDRYWVERIRALQYRTTAVPTPMRVRQGIAERKAYGGNASEDAKAILIALMEAQSNPNLPEMNTLKLEPVMPKKLSAAWSSPLGDDAEDFHGHHFPTLANLVLTTPAERGRIGKNETFKGKREAYSHSLIASTKMIADESEWDREAIERRAGYLASRVLELWPWPPKQRL